jgi:hypothetical protein
MSSNPSPRRTPRSSVCTAITEKTFARSNTRIKPVSPSATSCPVSGDHARARAKQEGAGLARALGSQGIRDRMPANQFAHPARR